MYYATKNKLCPTCERGGSLPENWSINDLNKQQEVEAGKKVLEALKLKGQNADPQQIRDLITEAADLYRKAGQPQEAADAEELLKGI